MSGKANNYRRNFLRIFYFFFIAVVIVSAASVEKAWCKPKNIEQAKKIAKKWRLSEKAPLNASLGHHVKDAVTYSDETSAPLYHIIYLETGGFIIVSADDLIEPIIAFSSSGTYDSSEDNPLGALVSKDMRNRIAWAKSEQKKINESTGKSTKSIKSTASQKKWTLLENDNDVRLESSSINAVSVSDLRVAPLIQSKWNQSDVGGSACYNYYTPNNYVCGCTATALSQLLRYHQWPQNGVGTASFSITVDGVSRSESLMGGDGLGGPYSWEKMPLVPDSAITLEERQAIGRLTHDAGTSSGMSYTSAASAANLLSATNALKSTFGYSNAVFCYKSGINISDTSLPAINTNLDAGLPVLFSIWGSSAGHSIVADGYGYNSSTLYHHLNIGWGGSYDAWYNLPDVDAKYDFNTMDSIIYNIFKTGSGEIVSGRITDFNGNGLAGAVVTATSGSQSYSATSNDKGIYALWPLPSNTTYTVNVSLQGHSFSSQITTTTESSYDNVGNIWGLNFSTNNPYYTLLISIASSASGTVTSSPGGIDCGSICSYYYEPSTVVTLTASPAATFTGWSGGGCSGTGTCTVTMDAAKNITATFTVPIGAVQLPQTGQTACYDESGNVLSCVGTGQDGEKQAGVAWPNPRFVDNGNQTVTDNLTGLIWTKDANLMVTRDSGFDNDGQANDGGVIWQHALDYIKKLNQENHLGHNDWRLPNQKELRSLVNQQQSDNASWLNGQGFSNVSTSGRYYWSSSSFAGQTYSVWDVCINDGSVSHKDKTYVSHVWPVRGGQSASFGSSAISLPRTGQTTCWDESGAVISCTGTGQDGELQAGVTWLNPRFIDNGNQTVTDNFTGLIWTKDANLMVTRDSGFDQDKMQWWQSVNDGQVTWQHALDYIKKLNQENYLGNNDWRLPNISELESLVNLQQSDISSWLNGQGFSNVGTSLRNYWSASTNAYDTSSAWIVFMSHGHVSHNYKTDNYYVWPVRGGQSGSLDSSVLYAKFTGAGIWKYNHTGTDWSQITPSNPQLLVTVGSTLYGTFEGLGIWKFDRTNWTQTTKSVPQMIVGTSSTLYGSFAGLGIWQWNGTEWKQTTSSIPQTIIASTSDLYGTFAGLGIWKFNGTNWNQLTTSIPEMLVTSGVKLYGTFANMGIWLWDGTEWKIATSSNPQLIAASSSKLYGSFAGAGIWEWDGAATWTQISPDTPTQMVASGAELYTVFSGVGVKKWDGTAWSLISGNEPAEMVVGE